MPQYASLGRRLQVEGRRVSRDAGMRGCGDAGAGGRWQVVRVARVARGGDRRL